MLPLIPSVAGAACTWTAWARRRHWCCAAPRDVHLSVCLEDPPKCLLFVSVCVRVRFPVVRPAFSYRRPSLLQDDKRHRPFSSSITHFISFTPSPVVCLAYTAEGHRFFLFILPRSSVCKCAVKSPLCDIGHFIIQRARTIALIYAISHLYLRLL